MRRVAGPRRGVGFHDASVLVFDFGLHRYLGAVVTLCESLGAWHQRVVGVVADVECVWYVP